MVTLAVLEVVVDERLYRGTLEPLNFPLCGLVGDWCDPAKVTAVWLIDPYLNFGGRDGIRTHDLLIANEEKSKLRCGTTIT